MKKIVVVIYLVIMILSCAGCGNSNIPEPKNYNVNRTAIDVKNEGRAYSLVVSGNNAYYVVYESEIVEDETDDEGKQVPPYLKMYSAVWNYNMETHEKEKVVTIDSDAEVISAIDIGDSGENITALIEIMDYNRDLEDSDSRYLIVKYSNNGKELSRDDITSQMNIDNSDAYTIRQALFNKDGSLVIWFGNSLLCMLDKDYHSIGQINTDKDIIRLANDVNGNTYACCYTNSDYNEVYSVDVEKEEMNILLKSFSEDEGKNIESIYDGFGENNMLLQTRDAIYVYREESDTYYPLVMLSDNNIVGNSIKELKFIDEGKAVCLCGDNEGNVDYYILELNETDNRIEQATDKKIIKYATCGVNSDIMSHITDFNNSYNEYVIDVRDYNDEENPLAAMNMDIIAGNVPDIVNMSDIDVNNYIKKGLLEDLTPYLQKDNTVNKDFFVDGLLDALKINGGQYYLMKRFTIETMSGKKSELLKYSDGWTAKEMMDYVNSKPQGTTLAGNNWKQDIFTTMFNYDIDSYMDWNTGEVNFDGEEFRKLIEFSDKFPAFSEVDVSMKINHHRMISEGRQLFDMQDINSVEQIQTEKILFDDDVMYVGYPNSKGVGNYILPMNAVGIISSSDNKDGAWEFIKSLLVTKSSQDYSFVFPASKITFEEMVKRETATESYINDYGENVEPRHETNCIDDVYIELGPATNEDIEVLRMLIKNSVGAYFENNQARNIVIDEIMPYFNKDKDLDSVIKVIQDKISKYVNENM